MHGAVLSRILSRERAPPRLRRGAGACEPELRNAQYRVLRCISHLSVPDRCEINLKLASPDRRPLAFRSLKASESATLILRRTDLGKWDSGIRGASPLRLGCRRTRPLDTRAVPSYRGDASDYTPDAGGSLPDSPPSRDRSGPGSAAPGKILEAGTGPATPAPRALTGGRRRVISLLILYSSLIPRVFVSFAIRPDPWQSVENARDFADFALGSR